MDDPNLDPRVKDLIFEKEFERVRQYERVKDVTGCVAIGGDVLDPGGEAVVGCARGRAAALNYYEISAAMARVSAGHETTLGASYEVVAGEPVALTGVAEPDYNENANDVWRMRRETLDRFVQAGRRVIIRNRAERRLRDHCARGDDRRRPRPRRQADVGRRAPGPARSAHSRFRRNLRGHRRL